MRDIQALPFVTGVQTAEVTGLSPDGRPQIRLADGTRCAARSLVPLTPAAAGREAAVVALEGGGVLLLGLLDPPPVIAETDGQRLVVEAGREVVLRCGKASLTLTADGRVTIRGAEILSRASGANRVQGGSIQLN